MEKPQVLVIAPSYPPFYAMGGPAVSLHNAVQALGDDVAMRVLMYVLPRYRGSEDLPPDTEVGRSVTSAPDVGGDTTPLYVTSLGTWIRRLITELADTSVTSIYINSVFSPASALLPLILASFDLRRSRPRIVVAPRGELNPEALAGSSRRKAIVLALIRVWARAMGRRLVWHATSDKERKSIKRFFPASSVRVVPNIPRLNLLERHPPPSPRVLDPSRQLVVGYLSRIDEKKNLLGLIEAADQLGSEIELRVAGNDKTNERYVDRCRHRAATANHAMTVSFMGHIHPGDIPTFLEGVDIVAVPTRGENFGHALWESLTYGRPLLTGTDVPWTGLDAAGAGWNVDPESTSDIIEALKEASSLTSHELHEHQLAAQSYASARRRDVVKPDELRALLFPAER